MATISRRISPLGRTRWRVQVRHRGHPPISRTFDRKGDATEWARMAEAAVSDALNFPARATSRHTVAEMVDRYLEEVLPRRYASEKERRHRRVQLGYWRREIGRLTLDLLTPGMVANARARLEAGGAPSGRMISPGTSNRYLAALSHCCTVAMREWGWLRSHPVRGLLERRQEAAGRVRYLSPEERQRLVAACGSVGHQRLEVMVVVAICTGARLGELVAARWRHVDLAEARWEIPTSKSGHPRTVPLAPPAVVALRSLPRAIGEADSVFGSTFPREAWNRARELAGLGQLRFHDLRHTAASYLAMSGASVRDIQEILGHRTMAMAQRYSHLSASHLAEVAERMAERWLR